MMEPDGNRIAIEGLEHLNDERAERTEAQLELERGLLERFAGAPFKDVLPVAGGVDVWSDDLEGPELFERYLYGASINVSEIRSDGVGEPVRLTMLLPDSATASVELRLVTDIGAEEVIELVRRHLASKGFADVELVPAGVWDGYQDDPGSSTSRAAQATLAAYGREPVLWPIQPFGGPWAHVPRQLGVPALFGGALGYGGNGGGLPDEYCVIESSANVAGLVEAECFYADLLDELRGLGRAQCESCTSPSAAPSRRGWRSSRARPATSAGRSRGAWRDDGFHVVATVYDGSAGDQRPGRPAVLGRCEWRGARRGRGLGRAELRPGRRRGLPASSSHGSASGTGGSTAS